MAINNNNHYNSPVDSLIIHPPSSSEIGRSFDKGSIDAAAQHVRSTHLWTCAFQVSNSVVGRHQGRGDCLAIGRLR